MRLLHTSDWHVGKAIRRNSRADEHRAVIDEIVALVGERQVDLVIVAGDLFDTASPAAESEAMVYRGLLDMARAGAQVAVIAGNHDNARRLRAVAPVFEAAGRVHLVTEPTRPDEGGVLRLAGPGGEEVRLALLPFVSQRGVVRAKDLMEAAAYENAQAYAERMRLLIEALCAGFEADTVNILAAHAFVHGGQLGGGERAVHFVEDYALSAQAFPATAGYVALGHVHRPQKIPGAAPIWYCGSPLQLDFGEENQAKQVNLVDIEPGKPPTVTAVPLSSGRALRTLTGTMDELGTAAADNGGTGADGNRTGEDGDEGNGGTGADGNRTGEDGDRGDWLRVVVRGSRRPGLADEVRELFGPRVVDVQVEDDSAPARPRARRAGRAPAELFDEFMAERNVDDDRVRALFAELLDAEQEPERV